MSEIGKNNKTAIVLFNLGGPDKLENIRPFLFNLFSDKWIIRLPFGIRHVIAYFIAKFRKENAEVGYSLIGGKSPLLGETINQKNALNRALKKEGFKNFQIFISMRYWQPRSLEVIKDLKEYTPDQIIMLPLYPQFSSSTTLSSFEEFDNELKKAEIKSLVKKIGCYFDDKRFIAAHIELIKHSLAKFEKGKSLRILFSAHSIPKKFVEQGDPYKWQINKTVEAILADPILKKQDSVLCYQSKVGPIEWLSPSTEHEVERAAKEKINLIIVPIAFVSEHIETLVELDIEYLQIASKYGIRYERVPALGINEVFINSLADLVLKSDKSSNNINCYGTEICPENFKNCICRK
jgi:ferrochelatase